MNDLLSLSINLIDDLNKENSYDFVVKENKQLKEYIININKGLNNINNRNNNKNLYRKKNIFSRDSKKYKRVVYEEETDSEPEAEEIQYTP